MADVTKAGDLAGQTLGQRVTSGFKKSFSLVGAGIGAGLGLATSIALLGANQLDAATRKLQADTGMTAAEAAKAEHALAGMYQNNLQGFAAIGDVMASVHNDLNLTGAAADAMTEKFLKFGTATGQDAAGAVKVLREVLDAWNLTAGDAGTIMDKLIVSQQKFGGDIASRTTELQTMAPAMQALNMTVDDGIALLNAFDLAGVDAVKVPVALKAAISALKPGQSLNDLIAQISKITDPLLRAQAAARVFGARVGVQMAQVIKPGMTSLADLTAQLGDTAGATDKAATAVESGFGAQFTLILHKAGGALAEFGTQFGPLVMLASVVGPSFAKAIGGGLGALAGLVGPKLISAFRALLPAAIASGTAQGVAMGGAAAASEVATEATGVAAGQAVVAAEATPAAVAAGTEIGTSMGAAARVGLLGAIVGGLGAALAAALPPVLIKESGALGNIKEAFNSLLFTILSGGDTAEGNRRAKAITELEARAFKQGTADALPTIQTTVKTALEDGFIGPLTDTETAAKAAAAGVGEAAAIGLGTALISGVGLSVRAMHDAALVAAGAWGGGLAAAIQGPSHQAGLLAAGAYAKGIADRRQAPMDAYQKLLDDLKTGPLSKSKETARLMGELTSKAMADGLKSNDPVIHDQALYTKGLILDELKAIPITSGKLSKDAAAAVAKGLKSKDPDILAAAQHIAGIIDSVHPVIVAKVKVPNISVSYTGGGIPHIVQDPKHSYQVFAQGGRPPVGVPSWVGESGRELFVPDRPGYIVPHAQSMAMPAAGAGDTYQIGVNLPTSARPDPFEVASQLRRLADFGVLKAK